MFLPLLETLEIPVLLTTHTSYENSETTMEVPSQQPILTSSELWGNESKFAFPTSACGTNDVSALQLGPRGARSMHFFSQHLRNSQEREPVFVPNTLSHQAMTYVCVCLMNCSRRPSVITCIENWVMKSGFLSDTRTPCTFTQNPLAPLLFQAPFPQRHLQSLDWILSSLFPKGLKDSSYFLSFSLLECCPQRVSFRCCNTLLQ